MKCPKPFYIKNEQGREATPVPCGYCGACMHNKRSQWSFRLKQELKYSYNGYFITFTYDGDNIPETINPETGEYLQTLDKKHFQDFMKRLRKAQWELTDIKIRFYCVGEYGTNTKRPHYHAIIFNLHKKLAENINEIWQRGHTHVGMVTDASIHYVTKYHVNRDPKQAEKLGQEREFSLMSKGIGKKYLEVNGAWHLENSYNYVINNGYKQALPRYYRDKLWNDEMKKELQFENRLNATEQHAKTIKALLELGITDPEEYIFQSHLNQAKKVKHKNNKQQKPDVF